MQRAVPTTIDSPREIGRFLSSVSHDFFSEPSSDSFFTRGHVTLVIPQTVSNFHLGLVSEAKAFGVGAVGSRHGY